MKITALKRDLVLDGPRPALYVRIETDEGLTGVGEATIHPAPRSAAGLLDDLEAIVVGKDPRQIERIWQLCWRRLFYRGGPVFGAAVAGIDMALWDLKGKQLGVPVYELLGGLSRDRVRLYVHVGGQTPEQSAESAAKAVAAGMTAVRCSPFQATDGESIHDHGTAVREAVRHMAAIREAVGEAADVLLECHGRLDPHWAVQLGRAVEPYRPFLIEDPIRPENDEALRNVRHHVSLPLASGERSHSKWDARVMIENEYIDYLRLDVCHAGGITEFRKIAGMAEAHHISLIPHNVSGPVATAAGLHLALALPNVAMLEAPWAVQPYGVLASPYPRVENGWALPPQSNGLGVSLHTDAMAQAQFAGRLLPDIRALDGGVMDW